MPEESSADHRGNLGRYALYGEIAAGGMATVHLARLLGPVGFSRTCAIKRLHPHLAKDPEFVAMFLEEARLATRVRHPNVVSTLDVVSEDGELFLVMEYVAGESLSRLVRKAREAGERVPPRYVVGIVCGTLDGLQAAHDALTEKGQPLGLVHRDISPQNIHVGVDGVARVLDFGIAKATNRVQETRTDQIKGKVAYMAPEQLAKGAIDRRADVYSASVVLWEALTGQRLFKADDVPSLVYAIINEGVEKPSVHVADLPPGLDEIVMKGLERDADQRWSSAREMAEALEKVLAPAPPREIGAWVEATAGEALEWRKDLVHQIESETSSSMPPPMRVETPAQMDVTSGVISTDRDPRGEAPTISNESDPLVDEHERFSQTSTRTPAPSVVDDGKPPRSRLGRVVMVVSGVVLALIAAGVLVVGGAAFLGQRWMQTSGEGTPVPPGASDGAAEPEPAIVIGAQRPGATGTTASSARPSPAPRPATSAPPHDECENPFVVDSRGIRHPKPQCFKK